ncbi:hypothetical protein K438DRAFT_1116471 [Mycena galopus ATCC 62051]|nr:hypothetical protein K438DRAFT_1116471 [Mycena galopus ATCC 62051]
MDSTYREKLRITPAVHYDGFMSPRTRPSAKSSSFITIPAIIIPRQLSAKLRLDTRTHIDSASRPTVFLGPQYRKLTTRNPPKCSSVEKAPLPTLRLCTTNVRSVVYFTLKNLKSIRTVSADEIKMSLETGILSSSNNDVSHRMARNSQRQSAVARRAAESRDAADVSKDLQRRISEEAEKRRISNETTKALKAQLKDTNVASERGTAAQRTLTLSASSSGRVRSARARQEVPAPAPAAQSDDVPSTVDLVQSGPPGPAFDLSTDFNFDLDSLMADFDSANPGTSSWFQDPIAAVQLRMIQFTIPLCFPT